MVFQIWSFMGKYGPQRGFLLLYGLLPDKGDLLPRRQVGEVRGALLSDQGDVLRRRQARVLPLGHHLILLQDI